VADEFGVPLLGRIPLEIETRKGGDAGVPVVVGLPESAQAAAFRQVAEAVTARLEAVSGLKLPTIG
jgi:ATP-binding protein involved in chromosome partitioning